MNRNVDQLELITNDMIDKAGVFSEKVDQKGRELAAKIKSKPWA